MKVYAVFKIQNEPPKYVIRVGRIKEDDRELTTVDFGDFTWTYTAMERKKKLFEDMDGAENRLEELRLRDRF